MKNEEAK